MPVTIPERPTTEPTDRSMPRVMMTAVIPSAMMPMKEKLRVMLNRLSSVQNTLETCAITRQMMASASVTQID